MPEYLAPAVYVEEVDTGSKPIEGVSTSTAGMVGVAERGPVGVPILVTSSGEFERHFGGFLDGDFGEHRYLPHAVEGFFTNGGKRCYVVRTLDTVNAQHAGRQLFDRGNGGVSSVLLRPAPEHSGTAANLPMLYVLDAAGAAQDDWIRIGDGSAAEYSQIAANPADEAHVTVNFPLTFAHDAGASVDRYGREADTTTFTSAEFTLVGAVEVGDDEVEVTEASAGDAALLAAGQLIEIGGPMGEYHFIDDVEGDGAQAVVTLTAELARAYDAGAGATVIDQTGGAADSTTLDLASRAGDRIVFIDPADFNNFDDRDEIIVFDAGTAEEEARRIGALSVLSLGAGAYVDYPTGTAVDVVRTNDDTATIATAITLDSVDGFAEGQTLDVNFGGGNEEPLAVHAVDEEALQVVFTTPFANPHGAGEDVALVHNMTSDPDTTIATVTLDSVDGFAAGQTLVVDPGGGNEESLDVETVNPGTSEVTFTSNFTEDHAPGEEVALVHTIDTVVDPSAGDNALILDSVDDIEAGQMLVVGSAGNEESVAVQSIDDSAQQVTFAGTFGNDHAPGDPVRLASTAINASVDAGSRSIALDARFALEEGALLRIGTAPDAEFAEIASIPSQTGIAPDAGTVVLVHPLQMDHPAGTEVVRQTAPAVDAQALANDVGGATDTVELDSVEGLIDGQMVVVGAAGNEEVAEIDSIDSPNSEVTFTGNLGNTPLSEGDPVVVSQRAYQLLGTEEDGEDLVVTDGNGFTEGSVIRVTLASGDVFYHVLSDDADTPQARLVEVNAALERAHPAGAAFVERTPQIEVEALDPGGWGDRLRISVEDEEAGLVSRTTLQNVIDPTHVELSSPAGVEAGTVLEVLDRNSGQPVGDPLKVEGVDSTDYTLTLAAPGLSAAQQAAAAGAMPQGGLFVRSREFKISVYLLRHPDPAQPSRNDTVIDSETFRYLSMDPRHSRYVEAIIGAIDGEEREWDQRPEGSSRYVRVRDLAANEAEEHSVRLGPETLTDVLPNGRERAARHALAGGDDALATLNDTHYIGDDAANPEDRTGLHSLRNVDEVSIVAIPGQVSPTVQDALISHCETDRYRFAVLDGPVPPGDTLTDVQTQRQQFDTQYAALYHPWLHIAHPFPTTGQREEVPKLAIPPSGHVVGIYARTDVERGVHKAPANEVVRGIRGLSRTLNKSEHDILNPSPVNIDVIRDFRPQGRGIRVWGARVITSDPDYKYVPVRRLLIFIEESIDEGLQWVVFEPNAEPLWARVRRSISDFLRVVWRNGALEGTTEEQAFFVKCDRTTMTQTDIDNGRLICLVGVAPVKPAEYVIIRIGLKTVESES